MAFSFNDHHQLEGSHAFLSASKYSWVNYDDNHMLDVYRNSMAAAEGTRLHAFAAEAISLGKKLYGRTQTLSMHVNDAIGFGMSPEVVLFYSKHAFGTADAIVYNERDNFLRIHDLKTGVIPAKMTQLYIYAALFCLEYQKDPLKIGAEFRIYQNDMKIIDDDPDMGEVGEIMQKIVHFDEVISQYELANPSR